MNTEEKRAATMLAQNMTHHHVLAWLVAREAARTGTDLSETHRFFVEKIIAACSRDSAPNEIAMHIESAATQELDALFALAVNWP